MTVYDVCIIGGGASGLIAAISAKRHNPDMSVLVIEKNDRVGKKLINTGNGRCNITNTDICADRYSSSYTDFFSYFEGVCTRRKMNVFYSKFNRAQGILL